MTKMVKKVLDLVAERKAENKKSPYVGTEQYWELDKEINSVKIFECSDCGEIFSYDELEQWCCDFERGKYICSCCYEDAMGEDL